MSRRSRPGVEAWLDLATADLYVANSAHDAAGTSGAIAALVCFHAHQVAEKALKAVLCAFDQPVPHSHDLVQLATSVSARSLIPAELVMACAALSEYGVGPRYPGFRPQGVSATEVAAALEQARDVQAWAIALLDQESQHG